MTVVVGITSGLVGISVLFSALWMKLLMVFAEHMIRFALWMNVGMMFGFAIATFLVSPFMSLFLLLGATINIWYDDYIYYNAFKHECNALIFVFSTSSYSYCVVIFTLFKTVLALRVRISRLPALL
jgi:hypothetical protein